MSKVVKAGQQFGLGCTLDDTEDENRGQIKQGHVGH